MQMLVEDETLDHMALLEQAVTCATLYLNHHHIIECYHHHIIII